MMTLRRGTTILALIGLIAGLGLLSAAAPATAHAEFLTSTPAPFDIWNVAPTAVTVTVSEAVQPGSPTITVTNMNGTRVDAGPATLSPSDPTTFSVPLIRGIGPSVYTVTWSVVSADDGHFTAGTFYFMIEYRDGTLPGRFPRTGLVAVSQPISPIDVALESAGFIAFSATFGATLVAGLLWIPAGSDLPPSQMEGPTAGFGAIIRLGKIGAIVFAGVAAARIAENLVIAGVGDLAGVLTSVFILSLTAQGVIGLAIAFLLWRMTRRPSPEGAFRDRPWEFLPALFLGFMLILLEVAVSHSATASGWWPLAPIADAAHLYGAALWIGALMAVLSARRWLREPTPASFASSVLEGVSRFALLGVVLVVSAGVVLGVVLVGTLDALVGTAYGWVILAKGALLVPLVVVGAWNRRSLHRPQEPGLAPDDRVRTVTGNVRTEAVLGAAVLVLAGLLVTMNPAVSPQPVNANFTLDATAGGLLALFEVTPWPGGPGSYIFQLIVYYAGNQTAFYGGGNATMSFLLEGGNGTAVTLSMEGPHGNHYVILSSPVLDAAGTWDIRANVRGSAGTPVTFAFSVSIHS